MNVSENYSLVSWMETGNDSSKNSVIESESIEK